MEIWELVAREHIRDILARYNWAGDAGRLDDLADTFCVDGVLVTRDQARVSSYFSVVTDTLVPDRDIWRIRHRKVSTDWAAPNSVMAR